MTDNGLTPRSEWAKSDVHKASTYSCGKCGLRLPDPHAVYAHLDAEHPRPKRKKKES
ncbi:MAG TPA: hypothetical protein VNJ54_15130 [Plantibacter sp.]|uniref:hypothetical protein n=1 Tax=Plantibacter sp. TaxID=1871045 RepID=UPI002B5271EC|nr:hypothetical protein [Plantibacter sp.]